MASDDRKQGDVSRRDFIRGTLAGAAAAAGGALVGSADAAMVEAASTLPAARGCSRDDELVFYNGKIRTMDSHNRVVSEVAIRDGRFVEVGNVGRRGPNAINLRGKVVIPGMIEGCDHIVSFGNYRPGYHTVLENATRKAGEDVRCIAGRKGDNGCAPVAPGRFAPKRGPLRPGERLRSRPCEL